MLEYPSRPPESGPSATSNVALPLVLGIWACLAGLAGNVVGAVAALSLLSVPPGTAIRPMGLAGGLMVNAVGTAIFGALPGIIGIVHGRRRRILWIIALIGVVLSFMPAVTPRLICQIIVTRHGLIMEE